MIPTIRKVGKISIITISIYVADALVPIIIIWLLNDGNKKINMNKSKYIPSNLELELAIQQPFLLIYGVLNITPVNFHSKKIRYKV